MNILTPQLVEVRDRVQQALDRVRPAVQADGGDVELVDIEGEVAKVRLHGACVGCPSANLTLQMGIERSVRELAPSVKRVIAVP